MTELRKLLIAITIGALIAIAILIGQASNPGYVGTIEWPTQVNQTDAVGIHDLEPQVNVTRASDP